MRNLEMDAFDLLLDEVLLEVANVEPAADLRERLMLRVAGEAPKRPVVMGRLFEFDDAVRRSPAATGWAVLAHAAAILLIAVLVRSGVKMAAPVREVAEISVPQVLKAPVEAHVMGGGGGQRDRMPVTKGTPPKPAKEQIVPPKAPPMEKPKIAVAQTVVLDQLTVEAAAAPAMGMMQAAPVPLVGMSTGTGSGTGLGSGNGAGLGPGSGGNTGGGPRRVGGGVSAPVLVYEVTPQFSDEARKAKFSGSVVVNIWVDEQGRPSHVRVSRGVGMGLDEKAVEAVKQYRFKPAMEAGKPVVVEMNVEVTFDIF